MPELSCSIDGCDKPHLARGFCSRHWQRWRRHGDPNGSCPTVTNHYSIVDGTTGRLTITSTDGTEHTAFYDLADHAAVSAHRWYVNSGGYAGTKPTGRRHLYMHRLLMDLIAGDLREVDHINGDRLDNRRVNLRVTTRKRNMQNQAIVNDRGSSKYRGVTLFKRTGKWVAQANVHGRKRHLGYFATEREAAETVAAFRAEQGVLAGYPRRHPHTPFETRT